MMGNQGGPLSCSSSLWTADWDSFGTKFASPKPYTGLPWTNIHQTLATRELCGLAPAMHTGPLCFWLGFLGQLQPHQTMPNTSLAHSKRVIAPTSAALAGCLEAHSARRKPKHQPHIGHVKQDILLGCSLLLNDGVSAKLHKFIQGCAAERWHFKRLIRLWMQLPAETTCVPLSKTLRNPKRRKYSEALWETDSGQKQFPDFLS